MKRIFKKKRPQKRSIFEIEKPLGNGLTTYPRNSALQALCIFVASICHIWHNNAMKFESLLSLVEDQPLFETGLLLAGDVDPDDIRRQLSRWVKAGKIRQLRRGLYMLESPYQSVAPHPFLKRAIGIGVLWIDPGIHTAYTECNNPTPISMGSRFLLPAHRSSLLLWLSIGNTFTATTCFHSET